VFLEGGSCSRNGFPVSEQMPKMIDTTGELSLPLRSLHLNIDTQTPLPKEPGESAQGGLEIAKKVAATLEELHIFGTTEGTGLVAVEPHFLHMSHLQGVNPANLTRVSIKPVTSWSLMTSAFNFVHAGPGGLVCTARASAIATRTSPSNWNCRRG
jgi:hypothetical protein